MIRSIFSALVLGALVPTHAGAQDLKAQGAKLFADQKCSLCHSIAGKGNAKGPLDEVGSKDSSADIREWITDSKAMTTKTGALRKPEMKQYTLENAQVDALVAYMSSLMKK